MLCNDVHCEKARLGSTSFPRRVLVTCALCAELSARMYDVKKRPICTC